MSDEAASPWALLTPMSRPVQWGRPQGVEDPAMSTDSATGLGDLFADTPTREGAQAPGGLEDLFAEAAPTQAPADPQAQATAGPAADSPQAGPRPGGQPQPATGWDDLFADDRPAPAGPAPADPPPAADAPTAGPPAGTRPAPASPTGDVGAGTPPAFGAGGPSAPPADRPSPQDGSAGGRVAARRQAAAAARTEPAAAQAQVSPEVADLYRHDRYARAGEFAPLVDRILGLGTSNPELQNLLRRFELTRDPVRDRQQRAEYQAALEPLMATARIQVTSQEDLTTLFDIAYDEILGIGPLGPLWRDESITEILVSGPDKVTVERHGRLELTPVRFTDLGHLERVARELAQTSRDDRAISQTNPLVTIQLPGARVQFVWRPLAVNRVAIAIRKFGALMDMSQLLAYGSLSQDMAAFLRDCVRARATILVSGGMGSGKTTFINALSEYIPDTERVVTIEDALELQLRNTHVEALVTKEAASADDTHLFGQDALLKASLRMRADRIIVGEIRDGAGCAVMLEAANTGHPGTMTTIHANTPAGALKRMSTLVRRVDSMPEDVAREEVASAIDVVVQVVKTRGRRYVSDISLVDSATGGVEQVFTGEYPVGVDAPVFRQVRPLGPDTDLARKMLDVGCDPRAWERI